MKHKILVILSVCFFQLQAEVAVFKHYGINDGLNSTKIRAITEDQMGFMWIGTEAGLYTFDGISFSKLDSANLLTDPSINHLHVMENNGILIGTREHGLLIYKNNKIDRVADDSLNPQTIYDMAQGPNNSIWLATNMGLFQFSNNNIKPLNDKAIEGLQGQKISSITTLDQRYIAIGQKNRLYIYDSHSKTIEFIELDDEILIHDVYKDHKNVLWVATSKLLLRYDFESKKPLKSPILEQASRILSIKAHQDDLWIATIDGGLYRIDVFSLETKQWVNEAEFNYSLSDKNIKALHISRDGTLWAGGFYHGLNAINLNLMHFNFETTTRNSLYCAKKTLILSIEMDRDGSLWLGNSDGLIHWQPKNNSCSFIDHNNMHQSQPFSVYHTTIDEHQVWVASSIGLINYDKQLKTLTLHNNGLPNISVFSINQMKNNDLLIATSSGLYQYNITDSTYHKIKALNNQLDNISYSRPFVQSNGQLLFSTNHGLLLFNAENQLQLFSAYDQFFMDKTIETIATNDHGELFISVNGYGLYHLDRNHQLVNRYFDEIKRNNILQIQIHDQVLWMSNDNGMISLDLDSKAIQFYSSEAFENYLALSKASYKDRKGQLYFAGNSGMVHFDPRKITNKNQDYPLVFNQLYLMDQPIAVNHTTDTGFTLSTPINQTSNLTFGHKDKIIGFGFVQPDYNTPNAIEYRYKLAPISTQWSSLAGRDRLLTFTNLKSGQYQLDIEATNLNNKSHKSIKFTVKTPPWLSWWAFSIYALLLIATIYFYIKRKIANAQRINTYLKKQVKQQTSHIAQQKKTVEDLMVRKNEIFSNVSHEFRTPITLILGPMEEVLKTEKDPQRKKNFAMVARNAKRLLDLVNQMLKLAQISETDTSHKQIIDLSPRLNMIIEPFIYLASLNGIKLNVDQLDNIKLELTEDALEIIFTNFLSNAIKYSDSAGHVNIGTRLGDDFIEIYVKDNGTGIAQSDQDKIFKRFNRLNHGSTEGIGIGLALVKEVADLNQAELMLNSESGQGSEFIVKFPIDSSLQNQMASHIPALLNDASHIAPLILTNKQTVLVIDDNDDMRGYIQQVLSPHFNCIVASDGTQGIATALKRVPDIVVCDVMMPIIDGFQVCRQLRSEIITSHIPLVLLTAVNEKSSRIKGWRENIDRYLNKPFDAQELILQLKNILNTRHLLITKNQEHSKITKQTYFSEIDQSFIDQLNTIINKGYSDPLFNVEKMASLMFVSDRQLQRKIKALLDRSPLDLLRETRLNNAAQMLATGKQIAYTSDMCGFSNASHFSYSFKKVYGMTPKAYQKLNHNNG